MAAGDEGMPPDPWPAGTAAGVEAVMASLEAAMVFELAAAYRAKMIEVGFSPEAAEQMAVDYHRTLVAE